MSFVRGRSVVNCLVHVLLLSSVLIATTSPASAGILDATWTAPTANTDGTKLTDLASYRVYYGSGSSPCPGSTFVSMASPTSSPEPNQTVGLRLSGLVAGTTYSVAVTAIDTGGNESSCSTTRSAAARAEFDVSPSGTVSFGSVSLGSSTDRTFMVSNAAGGTVSGTATVAPPFTIVSGSTFTLGTGATQAVTIRFTPATTATVSATVSFVASGVTLSRIVTGSGTTGGSGGGTGGGTGPVLTGSPTSVGVGGTVTAAWSGIAAPTTTDWIGLYSPGTSDSGYLGWMYVSCSQAPAAARASGSCAFPIPGSISPGTYELRLFTANGYTRLASSGTFTVTATASSAVALSATPTSVQTGGSVTAAWSGIAAPTTTDWIGLYSAGTSDGNFLGWMYVSCSQAPAVARASGSCAFPIPGSLSPGTYQLRLFTADGFTRLASSGTFTVTATASSAVTLSATPTSVRIGGSVTAAWSGIAAPTTTDWIGLYAPGTSDSNFLGWIYVSCSQAPAAARASGSCAFPIPGSLSPGTYQLRLFTADGFTRLTIGNTFSVTP